MLDRLDDTPAMVLASLAETLVQNQLAIALFGDHSRFTGLARSLTSLGRAAHVANLRAAYGLGGPIARDRVSR